MDKQPKWMARLFDAIHRHWQYHAPCAHINMKAFWEDRDKAWHVQAAPVYQQVLGGKQDGEKVWAGFVFDVGEFSREDGVWIQEQAIASICSECTTTPKAMTRGRFEGHPFLLTVFLEPIADTETVEIIDTLKNQIREMKTTEIEP